MIEVQDLQAKAAEAKRQVVQLEGEERKAKMAWEELSAKLNKAREESNRAEFVMHSSGASPNVPVPTYDDLLRQVTIQCPDKSHQERIAMIAQMRHGLAMDGVGSRFEKSHGGHLTGDEVQDVANHSYNVPAPKREIVKSYGEI